MTGTENLNARRLALCGRLRETYGLEAGAVFSAPGRTELGGNHTDHQRGRVVASAVTLSLDAAAAVTRDGHVRVLSEGMAPVDVDLQSLDARAEEAGTTCALVRGVAAMLAGRGAGFGGRGLAITVAGDLPAGMGLSSSACFEVLMATAIDELLLGGCLTPVERAEAARDAENIYFGKPCGLMDQLSCAVGGVTAVDFGPDEPEVERLRLEPEEHGFALYLVYSGAGHGDLTGAYAAITADMRAMAEHFGAQVLREVDEAAFMASLPELRSEAGDRAVLRAMHFFAEDRRAAEQAEAIRAGDFERFLRLVRESGRSSAMYLQNLAVRGSAESQPLLVAQAVCERALGLRGAVRVHGGGFGGAVQAWVPLEMEESFRRALSGWKITRLNLRDSGAVRVH